MMLIDPWVGRPAEVCEHGHLRSLALTRSAPPCVSIEQFIPEPLVRFGVRWLSTSVFYLAGYPCMSQLTQRLVRFVLQIKEASL